MQELRIFRGNNINMIRVFNLHVYIYIHLSYCDQSERLGYIVSYVTLSTTFHLLTFQ